MKATETRRHGVFNTLSSSASWHRPVTPRATQAAARTHEHHEPPPRLRVSAAQFQHFKPVGVLAGRVPAPPHDGRLGLRVRLEIERDTIDAVAQPRRRRAIVEDMAKVPATPA